MSEFMVSFLHYRFSLQAFLEGKKMNFGLTVGLIAVMIVVLGVFAIIQSRKKVAIRKKHPGYPKGYWTEQGVGIGVAIGVALGAALENIAIGIAIGVAIGVAIGSGLEKQHEGEIRPITEEEKKLKNQSLMFVIGILLLGLVVFAITYFVAG